MAAGGPGCTGSVDAVGTAAYKAWTEFIDGAKGTAPAAPAPAPSSAPGQPDFGYFVARVEPVLLNVCAQCHAGAGKGQFALVTHVGGTRFPLADHRKNFDTVVKLLVAGKPDQSKFLLKPLAERDGGVQQLLQLIRIVPAMRERCGSLARPLAEISLWSQPAPPKAASTTAWAAGP